MAARNSVGIFIDEDSCATLVQSLTGLVEKFRSRPRKPVSEAFCFGFFDSEFHADTALDVIKLRISEGAALEYCGGSMNGDEFIGLLVTSEVIEL